MIKKITKSKSKITRHDKCNGNFDAQCFICGKDRRCDSYHCIKGNVPEASHGHVDVCLECVNKNLYTAVDINGDKRDYLLVQTNNNFSLFYLCGCGG